MPDLPARYLTAVAFTALTPTLTGLAKTLARQLARFEGFSAAAADYEGRLTPQELNRRPALERLVFGPLRTLRVPLGRRIRLAIDGVDELESPSRAELLSALTGFSTEEPPSRVSVLLSTRGEDQGQDLLTAQVNVSRPGMDEITEYLQNLELPEALAVDLQAHADTWLQLRLLADLAVSVPAQSLRTVAGLDDLYQELLSPLAVNNNPEARIVVVVLSAAGSGPVLPLRVAVGACAALGGPADLTQFRHIVATLGGIVARAHPGTPEERLGLFHDTLVRHIRALTDWPISVLDAHASILEALGSADGQGARNYARDRAPEHLWALDRHEQALEAVVSRLGHRAADNRDLLQAWSDRAKTIFSPEDTTWLALQRHLLYWTGRAGDIAGAIAGFRKVLDARLRVQGPDHPDTLTTRRQLVYWIGEAGDTAGAVAGFRELLNVQLRVLGPDHPDTLTTRNNLANWTGEAGDTAGAVAGSRELLDARLRVLGPDHPDTLATRHQLMFWIGEAGHTAGAITGLREVLNARLRVLGRTTPTPSPPATTWRTGSGSPGIPRAPWPGSARCWTHCCGCWARTTPTPSTPGDNWFTGPGWAGIPPARSPGSASCWTHGCGCWALTTRTPSPPAVTWPTGPGGPGIPPGR
ncbi:tetratricopeptide repeat protein [Arthrobacter sp. ISL-65]|nr:tetratricopeptide repeat protein [Arthrobacter sp. ISL-65]MBT2548154.1 tetratricopeptide repeat protein [Arthrobacter sp. ISL-65]